MPVALKIYCDIGRGGHPEICVACRDRSPEGSAWRASLHKHLSPDPGGVDWPCPHGAEWGLTPPPLTIEEMSRLDATEIKRKEVSAELAAKLVIAGRAHWLRAHEKKTWITAEFEGWRVGIPNFGCACKREADEYIVANPPPIGDDEGMFVWFWTFHNKKNHDLGKPLVTLEEARDRWAA
jgi:hypothetical protein